MKIKLEFKKQDCWFGVYWETKWNPKVVWYNHRVEAWMTGKTQVDLWVCIIPMLPIHFRWERE